MQLVNLKLDILYISVLPPRWTGFHATPTLIYPAVTVVRPQSSALYLTSSTQENID